MEENENKELTIKPDENFENQLALLREDTAEAASGPAFPR